MKINSKEKRKWYLQRQSGQALVVSVVFFIFIALAIITGLIAPIARQYRSANSTIYSKQSLFWAESGIEDLLYRLGGDFAMSAIGTKDYVFDNAEVRIAWANDPVSGETVVTSVGDLRNRIRSSQAIMEVGTEGQFYYGVQVGEGGLYLDSGVVYGNVYSNGPITASSGGSNQITGSAIVANLGIPSVFGHNNDGVPPSGYLTCGKNYLASDLGQSFSPPATGKLNKVRFTFRKAGGMGTYGPITVRIVDDLGMFYGGMPELAYGSIDPVGITASDNWVEVTNWNSYPVLQKGVRYWIVIDCVNAPVGGNSAYYESRYSTGYPDNYSDGSYAVGNYPMVGVAPNLMDDLFFEVTLDGDIPGVISGYNQWNKLQIGTVSGITHANTVNYINAYGDLFCQTGTQNSKPCTFAEDPEPENLPISQSTIEGWKSEVTASGNVYNGNYSVPAGGATLGPLKIDGNLTVSSGAILTMTGTLWVTGNLILNGGAEIHLDQLYAENSGMIIVDGSITISNGAQAAGSGMPGSYILFLSTSTSLSVGVSVSGNAGATMAYAPHTFVNVSGGAQLKEVTGYSVSITGSGSVTYESGLANVNFSSGPSGSGPGGLQLNSWKEVQ